ncbi:3-dehydroquinate synthase [Sulfurospirillum sp. 1612]|uniref:3-dehydroquinate synthase n=1 Tax=Sulfurospirillum sp. 1612 TaxID=3094835 RepID=UPI002F930E91
MVITIDFNNTQDKNYEIFIETLSDMNFDTKVAIVTNPTVAALHLERLLSHIKADAIHIISVPDGEAYKNMETIQDILNQCFENRLDRQSILIALGGGVIGDMTGFAASIFQRGIRFIQIPTTLLAQVDASVGGKTGVNSPYGKNLIGAFWQPSRVYCDTQFLKTLPAREFSAGVAEIIKMAVTFDKDFFEWLENHDIHEEAALKKAVQKSIETKARVVAQDEREKGIRAVLNYGHTFAHVIENETHYTRYLHGEAVAIGMVMANALAVSLGLMEADEATRIAALLKRYHLPTDYEIQDCEAFYQHFFLDKKSHHDKITWVLPQGIGGFSLRDDVPKADVMALLGGFHG